MNPFFSVHDAYCEKAREGILTICSSEVNRTVSARAKANKTVKGIIDNCDDIEQVLRLAVCRCVVVSGERGEMWNHFLGLNGLFAACGGVDRTEGTEGTEGRRDSDEGREGGWMGGRGDGREDGKRGGKDGVDNSPSSMRGGGSQCFPSTVDIVNFADSGGNTLAHIMFACHQNIDTVRYYGLTVH